MVTFIKTLTKQQLFFLAFFVFSIAVQAQNKTLRLWYNKPASIWEATLPLGNGRLGMMPDGGLTKENITLNDITLWSGSPQDANDYDAYKHLPRIQKLLQEGKNDEAQAVMDSFFVCKGPGSGTGSGANVQFGCYQTLGNLQIEYRYKGVDTSILQPANYRRELSLGNATASCEYSANNVRYTREYFTSFGDDVGVIRLTADKPHQLNLALSLTRPERFETVATDGMLQMTGQLNNGTDGKGMQYMALIKPIVKDGSIKEEGKQLVISDASEVLLFFSAKTSYHDSAFSKTAQTILSKAIQKSYATQRAEHIKKYQSLFNRATVSIGGTDRDDLPTDERLRQFQKTPDQDNGLSTLFFQFGRYLTIASTRVGLLPPNLQGLWANNVQTPWNGDYHLDVNVQMNHWPVEVSNLSELDLPLAQLVKNLVSPGEKTAKAYYGADGWVAHTITNIWGYTEPGEDASWGATRSGSGWLCNNLWEHYLFTNDTAYLRDIYPVLKEAALFYKSTLVKDSATGWMVTSPSESPENSFILPNGKRTAICNGATIDNQIIRELFGNVITASHALHVDDELASQLTDQLKTIPPPGAISKDGRIMEWLQDYKEVEPTHRHISHLYGLYPASLITPENTPDLAEASKKTLDVRGDDGPSWSIAYRQIYWARLHDGNRAYHLFTKLMRPVIKTDMNYGAGGGLYPNFLSAGPPFQIDANYGGAAALAEMLIQSHAGFIELLPAVPDAWKKSGEIKGLKARGNITVSFAWKDGKVTRYTLTSAKPQKVRLKVNGNMVDTMSQPGK